MNETRILLAFGKARVRTHVRHHEHTIAIKPYDTTRPPGVSAGEPIFTSGLPETQVIPSTSRTDAIKARLDALLPKHAISGFCTVQEPVSGTIGYAFANEHGGRAYMKSVRSAIRTVIREQHLHHTVHQERLYQIPIFQLWESPGVGQVPQEERNVFKKAVDRLDAFLKARWTKAKDFFKGTPSDLAETTLGAGMAGPEPLLAQDLASARDRGPEEDPPDEDGLPWAAEDHASAKPNEPDPEPEINDLAKSRPPDFLAKAYQLRDDLQKAITSLDGQLAGPLSEDVRGRLLATHLDCLVQADALTDKIEVAERLL